MRTDERPTTLKADHNYNLRNQGWPTVFSCLEDRSGDDVLTTDPVSYTKTRMGFYPSNADILYAAKAELADNPKAIGSYSPWLLQTIQFGNTPAPRGHFIINAFDRNRTSVSSIPNVYDPDRDLEVSRPVSTAFYAGRVWYLMQDGNLYFSQILTDLSRVGKCYQEQDPTAEKINELLATDGGRINIDGMARGLHLEPIGVELVIFADNGIWAISGGDNVAFKATEQQVRKITDVGAISQDSIVVAENQIFYWSEGGIYTLNRDQVSASLEAVNISESVVQTLYLGIPFAGRKFSRSFYDKASKKIYWFYNDQATYDGILWRYKYNKILILDLTLQAFYTYSIGLSDSTPFVAAMVEKQSGTIVDTATNVVDSANDVIDGAEQVTVDVAGTSFGSSDLKLICFEDADTDDYKYAFGEFRSREYLDWGNAVYGDSADYSSYLETGDDVVETIATGKEAARIVTFMKRTETAYVDNGSGTPEFDFPSGCTVRAKWQWTDSATAKRWTDRYSIYRLNRPYLVGSIGDTFDYGYEVIENSTHIRGMGKALRLIFESETGKDFHLLGWAIPFIAMTDN